MLTIILRIFPQESHLNATFKFAEELQKMGHKLIYVGTKHIKNLIIENDFEFYEIDQKEDIIEKPVNRKAEKNKYRYYRKLLSTLSIERESMKKVGNEILSKDFFEKINEDLNPDLYLVDSVYKANILPLLEKNMPVALVETTVSTIRAKNKPPLSSSIVPKINNKWSNVKVSCSWILHNIRQKRMNLLMTSFEKSIKEYIDRSSLDENILDKKRYKFLGFHTVPEINTTFFEFDFPHQKKENHFYVAPNQLMKRKNLIYDYMFDNVIEMHCKTNNKLVFCSFGTMAWRYYGHEQFLEKLTQAFKKIKEVTFLVCVEDENQRLKLREMIDNESIYFFRRVPQVDLLEKGIDLMIGHGGVNSINECILTNTPMLIYPGSKELDQIGNASRVVYHGLGMRGTYSDSVKKIINKINHLLSDKSFSYSLKNLNKNISTSNQYTSGNELISKLIPSN
ncbi:hypothetical protein EI427_21285 [Flammeovirga pectinis]|uniref:Glycosyl transferase family 28 C-terminal domain-containing protein n=1 Tax=Flammeovirga pectinis TaxID=2494373 RepID=A0A3S9P965_9BACT|nr:glycosyltransferase [Flammeovirga pectinis]AZQ64761.1 hypothetical protein EI427_21285 [Flammeovirga pectinis]